MDRPISKPILFLILLSLCLGVLPLSAVALESPFQTGPYGSYEIGEDGLELSSSTWQQAVCLIEEQDYADPSDCILEADLTCLSGVDVASGCRMGFVLFSNDSADAYVYFTIEGWNTNTSRGFQVNSVVNGAEKGLGGGSPSYHSFSCVPGETYHMRIRIKDGNVRVFIDGQKLFEVDIPEENQYGSRFGLVACVGRASFDNLILDDTYVWTSDGKAGETVPKQTETEKTPETDTQTETEKPDETVESETETQETPAPSEPSSDKGGKSPWFWPLLIGVILVPGCISFVIFFKIGSGKKNAGGDAHD